MDGEEVDYISSVDPYVANKAKPSVDAPDEKTLVRIVKVLENQIELYHTISGMKRFDTKKFTADQREVLCAEYVQLLSSLLQLINNAIDDIKEKSNG